MRKRKSFQIVLFLLLAVCHDTFPEFKENNVSEAEISAEVVIGEGDLTKAVAKLATLENEKKIA